MIYLKSWSTTSDIMIILIMTTIGFVAESSLSKRLAVYDHRFHSSIPTIGQRVHRCHCLTFILRRRRQRHRFNSLAKVLTNRKEGRKQGSKESVGSNSERRKYRKQSSIFVGTFDGPTGLMLILTGRLIATGHSACDHLSFDVRTNHVFVIVIV